MERSIFGFIYSHTLLILSVFSCMQYIYSTYSTGNSELDIQQTNFFNIFELVLASLFLFDWMLSFFLAEHKLHFLSSFFSVVDLMTVIPKFATYGQVCPSWSEIRNGRSGVIFCLCGMGTTRILRALRIRRRLQLIEDEVKRFIGDMVLRIIIMILFNAALMQYLEAETQPYTFDTWAYYMLVTVATVGYGDITPKTTLGRFAAMAMISFAIITVPKLTNELIEKMNQQSVYSRAHYHPKGRNSQHVLICGDLNSTSLREFFYELFHEDHDTRNLHAVVLQPEPPSYEIMSILKDPQFSLSVTFLEGDPLHEKDLARAVASEAKAIFIMTNKFSTNPDEEDAKTILQQFTIQKYLRLTSNTANNSAVAVKKDETPNSLFCLQLIRPENKRHLVTSNESSDSMSHVVICLNEIKMGVIAKAAVYPGASTLIMNLLSSFSDEDADDEESQALKNINGHGIETLDDDEHSDWVGEYRRGCDWEIYMTELSREFEGKNFCVLSELLYQNYDIVLFALEVEDLKNEKSERKMLLNPADFVIPPKSDYKIQAFVLAKNKTQSDLTFSKDSPSGTYSLGGKSTRFSQISLLATMASGIANSVPLINNRNRMLSSHAVVSPGNEEGEENDGKGRGTLAWQELLKKYDGQKSAQSLQEELQKIEDKYLKENFYIRDSLCELQDAIIKSSVMEELRFVDNHIIIIGKGLSNLYDLIRPLRSKHLGVLKHIVIVYPKDFPLSVWQRISLFESIWIIRGSALEEADIRRAGIFKAKQVVVLADPSDSQRNDHQAYAARPGSKKGVDALVDADAIFCYQCVRKMNEQAHVVVEIVLHTNVGYLDPESRLNSGDIDYKFTPEFASGALFSTSLLDTLVCQAFYNTKIIEVVNKLIGSVDNREEFERKQKRGGRSSRGSGGAGGVKGSPPSAGSPQKRLEGSMFSSSLYQISIPEGLESRTYGALFQLLCKRKQIPLGLLRGTFPHTNTGPKANRMPYVFTNPPKDTELFTCDKVFILSPEPIRLKQNKKDDLKEMHDYETRRKSKLKIADDTIQIVRQLREDVQMFGERQECIEVQLQNMSEDLEKKLENMLSTVREMNALNHTHNNSNNHVHNSPDVMKHRNSIDSFNGNNNKNTKFGSSSFIGSPVGLNRARSLSPSVPGGRKSMNTNNTFDDGDR